MKSYLAQVAVYVIDVGGRKTFLQLEESYVHKKFEYFQHLRKFPCVSVISPYPAIIVLFSFVL